MGVSRTAAILLAAIGLTAASLSAQTEGAETRATPKGGTSGLAISAFYRAGQVFITWKELADVKGEKYDIYRSDEAITPATLAKARKLGVVGEDSGAFKAEQFVRQLEKKTGVKGYNFRHIIRDNPGNDPKAQLAEGVGLFVYTVKKTGRGHYCVVPVIGGKQDLPRTTATTEAVTESVALPGAVLVWKHPQGTAAVYTHWMDGATWDADGESNAYNFGVAVPKGYDGKAPLPIMFYGHGMSGTYAVPDQASYWRCLWIWPGDRPGCWFMGRMNRDKTKVVNYVEQRIRWMYQWLLAGRANQFWRVDPRLVQAHGHSMGGTMCNALAMRMGDIFCTTVSSAGATIHSRNRVWVNQAARLWGPVEKNLPLHERVYEITDDKLLIRDRNVMGAWDYQDYGKWSLANMGRETAFLLLSHGKRDGSVVFEPVPDFLDALQRAKRPFAAYWNLRGHSWSGYGVRNDRMGAYRLPIDESLPAFANASNNDDPRKTDTGTINGKLEWSASGNDFDSGSDSDDIVDTPETYAVTIRSLSGPATVDVTPRRLQRFKPVAGKKYAWENIDCADPKNASKVDAGTVVAGKYGLLTVEKFKVGKAGWGNRLVIRPVK